MSSERALLPVTLLALGFLSAGLAACSSSSGGGASSGGKTGSGGAMASGGHVSSGGTTTSGGSVGSGGSSASGGSSDSGGSMATGGKSSGGTTATGGSSAPGGSAAGGTAAGGTAGGTGGKGGNDGKDGSAGGSGTGGSDTGGKGGTGGSGGNDGAAGGSGAGGTAAGGTTGTGTGGSGGGSTATQNSPGCGSASPLKTSTSLTESIGGTNRKWMLDVPTDYDTNKAYRLIFVWHPLGGSGSQIVSSGYNGLKALSNGSAVFATADGLNGSNSEASGTGWWNANGGDMKLFKAMLDKINAGLCIDQTRIFTTGFSFGGMMSYTLPFQFNVFRATAPCSGKEGVIPYDATYDNPVPIMAFHGDTDTFVLTSLGKAFFQKYVTRNKCGTQTTAVSPTGCVQYQGCSVPTTWCLFPGGHTTWSEEPGAIWKFFSSF